MDPKKLRATVIYPLIARMFHVFQLGNHCQHVCEFPVIMKLAGVSSLFKKNDNLKNDNYRLVSSLPSLSKVYERVMGKQLSDFFDKSFSALLSAFRKRYSCQSTLSNLVEHLKKTDNGEYVAYLYMDLKKAFDRLPHCLTISKLHPYGLSREACCLRGHKKWIALGKTRSE